MFEFFMGFILLGLTTALTAVFMLYPNIFKKAKELSPKCSIVTSTSFRVVTYVAYFGFAFIIFPLVMLIMVNDDMNESFSEHLAVKLSQA